MPVGAIAIYLKIANHLPDMPEFNVFVFGEAGVGPAVIANNTAVGG